MQKITLKPRSCECCGGNDLDSDPRRKDHL
jgi:hypothetical protein